MATQNARKYDREKRGNVAPRPLVMVSGLNVASLLPWLCVPWLPHFSRRRIFPGVVFFEAKNWNLKCAEIG